MNYTKAKTEAKVLSNVRKMPHVILFDGLNYHVEIASRHKGKFVEMVMPEQVKAYKRVSAKKAKGI